MTSDGPVAPAALTARRVALATTLLLVACVGVAALRSASWPASLALAVTLSLPALLPLRGILRGTRRTYTWAPLCVGPYVIYGITESIANPQVRPLAGVVLMVSLILFVSLVAYLRLTRPGAGRQPG